MTGAASRPRSRLLIGGTQSGVGKTSLAVGLMAAFSRRGLRVAPFKVGPDYLDPGYHQLAAGRASSPLDTWMLGDCGMVQSFARSSENVDLSIIEGMMGLHDGADPHTDSGSTARVAKLLHTPTVLVLDAAALARSVGAVVLGYRQFDPEVPLAGVIANRVGGEGHARFLRPPIEEVAGVPLLGWLPPTPGAAIPERHLGLVCAGERPDVVERLADLVESRLDLDRLLELARSAPPLEVPSAPARARPSHRVRIGVARDAAFCFYYPDNLTLLEAAGAELVFFSPIRDAALPEGVAGLYLGGGYPELHAETLAANMAMREAIRVFAAAGRPIYAECGGYMYLCQGLATPPHREHAMVGLLPGRCLMEPSLQAIGYREVRLARDGVLGPAGRVARGHEFRYSFYEGPDPGPHAAFTTERGPCGYASGSVLASYCHLHFGSNPELAYDFVKQCAHAP